MPALRVKLALRAMPALRVKPVRGKLGPGLSAGHRCAPLEHDPRWDAPRRLSRRRHVHNCCDWPPRRRRRDSFRHHHR